MENKDSLIHSGGKEYVTPSMTLIEVNSTALICTSKTGSTEGLDEEYFTF